MNQTTTGHVCNCCHGVNGEQTQENPMRTDWCVKCGHRGEGIKRAMKQLEWGQLRVIFTAPPQPPTLCEFAATAEYALLELRSLVTELCDAEKWIAAERLERAAELLQRLTNDNAGLEAAAESAYLDNLSLLDNEEGR